MNLEIHPQALDEAQNAYDFYFERNPDAAEAFMSALDRKFDELLDSPMRYPSYRHGTRRALLRRYPFQVIYQVLPDRIRVIALAHESREPVYWQTRE